MRFIPRALSSHRARLLSVVVVSLLGACGNGGSPKADTGTATVQQLPQIPTFNADSSYALLVRQVAFGPRVPEMPGHARQLEWMKRYLSSRSDTLVVDSWEQTVRGSQKIHMTNLLARFNPKATDRILLLTHWDTRPTSDQEVDASRRKLPLPGANDGASGTAVLMSIADVLKSHSPTVGVDLLFVDGEDYGPDEANMYLGARRFVLVMGDYHPHYGILIDMIGDKSLNIGIEESSNQFAPAVVERVWGLAEQMGYAAIFPHIVSDNISDDHIPLNEAGIKTIDLIDWNYGPGHSWWHTQQDTPDKTSAASLGIIGKLLLTVVYSGG